MSIVMTGGGTGGHLAIIKAVKEHLNNNDLVYIGSTTGQDKAWFDNDKEFRRRYFLTTRGVVNQGIIGKVKSIWMLIISILRAIKILRKEKASVVFSVGGFSAAPTSFAAKLLRIPLVIHEQNAAMGTLNKVLKPYSNIFISSYIDESPVKAYPVKKELFETAHERDQVKSIIFLGGSQGARAINELAINLATELKSRGIKIYHQAGEKNLDLVQKEYDALEVDAEVFGFTTELSKYMNLSDIAIARSGASTLWELSANSLPAIFIPYPYAAGDHQYYNADFLVKQELSWVMREDDLNVTKILNIIDESMLEKSKGLSTLIDSSGSYDIANILKSF